MITVRMYTIDSLYLTSYVFYQLQDLLHYRRTPSEKFLPFEECVAGQIQKFNSRDVICALPECMAAFYLLDAVNLDEFQRTEITMEASAKDESFTPCSSTGAFLRPVTSASVAFAL